MSIVEVTAGARPYRWLEITEKNGQAITPDQVKLALVPQGHDSPDVDGGDWYDPDDFEQVSTSVVRVALQIDDRFALGTYRLRAVVTDTPEVEIVYPKAKPGASVTITVR